MALDPPAYQEYAANMLANLHFRRLTLAQRGLLWTLRLELWVNRELPSEEIELAAILGVPVSEISEALPMLTPFLSNSGESMVAPELENYREGLNTRRARQSEGGKKGAETTNRRRGNCATNGPSSPASTPPSRASPKPQLAQGLPDVSLVQPKSDQASKDQESQTQSLEKGDVDSWINSYEAAENSPNAYRQASKGR